MSSVVSTRLLVRCFDPAGASLYSRRSPRKSPSQFLALRAADVLVGSAKIRAEDKLLREDLGEIIAFFNAFCAAIKDIPAIITTAIAETEHQTVSGRKLSIKARITRPVATVELRYRSVYKPIIKETLVIQDIQPVTSDRTVLLTDEILMEVPSEIPETDLGETIAYARRCLSRLLPISDHRDDYLWRSFNAVKTLSGNTLSAKLDVTYPSMEEKSTESTYTAHFSVKHSLAEKPLLTFSFKLI